MSKINQMSDDWLAVQRWAKEQMALAHEELRMTGTPIEDTENLRGRIFALEELLALPDEDVEKPIIPTHDNHGIRF